LQDVHWSEGLFGYFPTYTLGNVYAGCLHETLRAALPNLDADLAKGDTTPATTWLRKNLQQYGGLRSPAETISHAAGVTATEGPLLDYLERKFTGIYEL
jgi:carboxypeptidase Taq